SVGFHPISVQYNGDTNFQMSTSPNVTETIQEAGNSNTMYLRLEEGQDVLDPAAPAGTPAQHPSTGPVNPPAYKKIGPWTAPPAASPAALGPGAAATVYLLLNNGDDAGTIFGLRGDVFNGAQLIGSGKLDNITGVTRSNPLSVTVNIPALVPGQLAAGDVLRLEVYGIVEGTGPHASATGLNLAFDAVGRDSRVFLRRRPIVANDAF